jgi:type VI secretion system secreted protein VgrG
MTQMQRPIEPGGNVDVSDEIPYRRNAGSGEADGIHEWQPVRQIGPGSSTVGGFNYKWPRPQAQTRSSKNDQGDAPRLEVYENTGGHAFAAYDDGDKFAKRRMEERDAPTRFFEASGNDRTVQPGRSFRLGDHSSGASRPVRHGEPAKPRSPGENTRSCRQSTRPATTIRPARTRGRNIRVRSRACARTSLGGRAAASTLLRPFRYPSWSLSTRLMSARGLARSRICGRAH